MSELQPIIIKRKKVVGGDGHHGGAWKVAYADFVTAMMAFFLLMWLLNATSEEQRRGLADYFDPAVPISRNSGGGSGALNGDDVLSPSETSMSEETGDRDPKTLYRRAADPDAEPAEPKDEDGTSPMQQADPASDVGDAKAAGSVDPSGENDDTDPAAKTAPGEDAGDDGLERLNERLQAEFAALSDDGLIKHFSLRMTPEGLVIEIGDLHGKPLFASGDSAPRPLLKTLIEIIAPVLAMTTNDIAVVGHTDATPFVSRRGYSNWELSADRANMARRMLSDAGLEAERIVRVSGRADTDPIDEDPSNARNRRIAITLLRKPLGN